MSEQTPEQQVLNRIKSISGKMGDLQSDVRLSGIRDAVEDLDSQVNGLRAFIQNLRKRGYVFGKGFEAQADGYVSQWRSMRMRITQEIDRQTPILERELGSLETQHKQIQAGAARPMAVKALVDRLESALETFDDKVDAVKSSVQGMYDTLQTETGKFRYSLDRIDKMLEKFDAAVAAGSFGILPTEGTVMAVKAVFSRDQKMDKDDPEGFLFLTDQRLLFEQNQEIATKKVLFITTEKQKVQKLVFETPVALVETVQADKKGMFGHEDHLAITFKSGAPFYQTWFHLEGQDSNDWQELIGKVRSGGMAGERVVAVDQAEVEKVKAAPSQCPNCGAPIKQVVLRGLDSITCEYCQFVIRL